jgi:recombination associated protein RdgC
MWFKNLLIYRLPAPWAMTSAQLEELLAEQAFTSGSSQDKQTHGWAPPREGGSVVYGLGGNLLVNLRIEKKLLPTSVVNQVARAKAQE